MWVAGGRRGKRETRICRIIPPNRRLTSSIRELLPCSPEIAGKLYFPCCHRAPSSTSIPPMSLYILGYHSSPVTGRMLPALLNHGIIIIFIVTTMGFCNPNTTITAHFASVLMQRRRGSVGRHGIHYQQEEEMHREGGRESQWKLVNPAIVENCKTLFEMLLIKFSSLSFSTSTQQTFTTVTAARWRVLPSLYRP